MSNPRTLKLLLSYDGTDLVGWQRQAQGVSVQGLLEQALARIEGRPVTVIGAGRTDAGVHALGQVASCRLEHPIDAIDLRRALNAMLPDAVRVLRVEDAPPEFHARYSARGKRYRYVIHTGGVANPFLGRYSWHVACPLSVERMAEGARLLVGTHDFAAFQSSGSDTQTTVRTIGACAVARQGSSGTPGGPMGGDGEWDGELVTVEVLGDGFLRHMVRAIVGSLVEVGIGRRTPEWMASLIDGGRRHEAGRTAPAEGLWLVEVRY